MKVLQRGEFDILSEVVASSVAVSVTGDIEADGIAMIFEKKGVIPNWNGGDILGGSFHEPAILEERTPHHHVGGFVHESLVAPIHYRGHSCRASSRGQVLRRERE